MKFQIVLKKSALAFVIFCFASFGVEAQKQQYSSLAEALRSGGNLYGNQGPQSVNWTNGGNKYSYTDNDEIHSMDPQTLKDELIFTNKGLTFPATGKPFEYESFQWSHDSKHLVFKTNLRRIYR